MSYVESVIGKNEVIEYEGKVSIWSIAPTILMGVITLPLFGIGLLFFIAAALRYKTTELAITNKRIVSKFGFISRQTIELQLAKIESIQVSQSILGRMLNYGSIVAAGAGNPQAPVPGISDPIQFRTRFLEIQEIAEKKSNSSGS